MLAEVVRSRPGGREGATAAPEGAFAARARLCSLRDALDAGRTRRPRTRWNEPAVFFFHRERQQELEAARPRSQSPDELSRLVAQEVFGLSRSVDLRQTARAVPGLLEASRAVPQGRPLADLLAVPDDETVLVLHPERRIGMRFTVRGIATVNQFHVLIMGAFGHPLPSRFRVACENVRPVPAGVPMMVELPHQCFRPAALRRDGTIPASFAACDQWLWGWEPLAAAPRIDGERVILLDEPPAHPQRWEVELLFPAMAAQAELQQVLTPFQTVECLGRLAGAEITVQRSPVPRTAALAAA